MRLIDLCLPALLAALGLAAIAGGAPPPCPCPDGGVCTCTDCKCADCCCNFCPGKITYLHYHAGEVCYLAGGKHVGSYRYADQVYMPLKDGKWGSACKPPVAPPPPPKRDPGLIPNPYFIPNGCSVQPFIVPARGCAGGG